MKIVKKSYFMSFKNWYYLQKLLVYSITNRGKTSVCIHRHSVHSLLHWDQILPLLFHVDEHYSCDHAHPVTCSSVINSACNFSRAVCPNTPTSLSPKSQWLTLECDLDQKKSWLSATMSSECNPPKVKLFTSESDSLQHLCKCDISGHSDKSQDSRWLCSFSVCLSSVLDQLSFFFIFPPFYPLFSPSQGS